MAESTAIDKSSVVTVTNPKTDAVAREKLTTARIGLLLKAPFFGQLATRMTLTNADAWCGTAATDGRKFYYNSEFVDKMPLKQLEFLVGHEILHAVYDHMGRRGDRQPRLSNIAADYCVNQDLIEQRIGEKISVCPILFDNKFKDMSYEEVYDYLYQNAKKINIDQLEQMILDDHLEEEDENGNGGSGDDGDEQGGKRPRLSKEERDAIKDEIKGAVIAAAQSAGAGNLPSGVKRLLRDLTEPVIGWKELLQQQIQSKQAESDPYTDQISDMEHQALQTVSYDHLNDLTRVQDHQEFLLKLLTSKDSFVRKKIIDQNLSYLNARLTWYLDRIGLPHTVKFQNDLSVSIEELGRELDFDNLSRGERNRLILSMSWAFRDVWESLYSPINILFIDEMIDSGLDTQGVENALALLKKMTRERNKSIWLVSHRDELAGRVENILRVVKENGFTSYNTDVDIV